MLTGRQRFCGPHCCGVGGPLNSQGPLLGSWHYREILRLLTSAHTAIHELPHLPAMVREKGSDSHQVTRPESPSQV